VAVSNAMHRRMHFIWILRREREWSLALKAAFPLLARRLFSGLKLFFFIATLRIFPNGNRHSTYYYYYYYYNYYFMTHESDNTWRKWWYYLAIVSIPVLGNFLGLLGNSSYWVRPIKNEKWVRIDWRMHVITKEKSYGVCKFTRTRGHNK
jgi:hypothetical protein